jgi:hypothetical protein
MPRNGSGTYNLPAGNPVISGTTIQSTWANTTLTDIASALTGSLPRDGQAAMTGALPMGGQDIQNAGSITANNQVTAGYLSLTSVTLPANGLYLPGTNTLGFSTASTARGSINSTGNWSLVAPTSGVTLALGQFSGGTAIRVTDPGANATTLDIFTDNTAGYISPSGTAATALNLRTNGNTRLSISAAGNATVNAPASGTALTVNALAGQLGANIVGDFSSQNALQLSSTANTTNRVSLQFTQSGGTPKTWAIGIDTDGGTDNSFDIRDLTRNAIPFAISSAGVVVATDDGGTPQTVGWRDTPPNSQSGNYTLTLADRGKAVYYNGAGGHTYTVPASTFQAGATVVIFNRGSGPLTLAGSGATIIWLQGGTSSVGSRTIAASSVCTLWFESSANALLTGSGIS